MNVVGVNVNNEAIAEFDFTDQSDTGPWTIRIEAQIPSEQLSDWLFNPDDTAVVKVLDDSDVQYEGRARVNCDESSFLLVGRGPLTPVDPQP